MDRREAILSITTVLGYTVTPASIIAISGSCKGTGPAASWTPSFFPQEDAFALEALGEAILPKTETPGSIEVGAHLFVDKFLSKVASSLDQEKCLNGLEFWKNEFSDDTGKPASKAGPEDIQQQLAKYFNVDKDRQSQLNSSIQKDQPDNQVAEKDYYIYSFLMMFKRLLMLGYFASEEIGENVLSYLPVPGSYRGCIPVAEVGNDWSL